MRQDVDPANAAGAAPRLRLCFFSICRTILSIPRRHSSRPWSVRLASRAAAIAESSCRLFRTEEVSARPTQWLQELDNLPGNFRILLCLDEFERLEDLFPGNRQDLLRLMGLFRATIQHRRRLRLLVSGVAPFDELGQIWNDHFINVREIRVGHLDRDTAIDLLIHPLSEFPADAVPETVAARVFERTGGQPYLLQLYGSLLIARLNERERKFAVMEDVAHIEEEAMSQGAYYFRHTYESAPADARRVLEELAAGRRPDMLPPVRRWLLRRGLIDDEGVLCIPVSRHIHARGTQPAIGAM